jgi:hypothetical protein
MSFLKYSRSVVDPDPEVVVGDMYQGRRWCNGKADVVTRNGAGVTRREWCNRKVAVVKGMG